MWSVNGNGFMTTETKWNFGSATVITRGHRSREVETRTVTRLTSGGRVARQNVAKLILAKIIPKIPIYYISMHSESNPCIVQYNDHSHRYSYNVPIRSFVFITSPFAGHTTGAFPVVLISSTNDLTTLAMVTAPG